MAATAPHPIEIREQAKALYLQGLPPSRIEEMVGVKRTTIMKWSERGQWMALRDGTSRILVARGTTALLRDTTSRVREALQEEANAQVAELRKTPIKSAKDLANTPHRQGRAAVLKTLVESVSMIEDWDAQKRSGLVLCDLLTGEPGSTTEISAQVEMAPCVSDATIGSVPTTDLNALTATSVQAVESTPLADAPTDNNGSCAKSDAPAP